MMLTGLGMDFRPHDQRAEIFLYRSAEKAWGVADTQEEFYQEFCRGITGDGLRTDHVEEAYGQLFIRIFTQL